MAEFAVTNVATPANPEPGDLALSEGGFFFLRTSLREEVEQRLRIRLCFFRGEWFLNTAAGTPWFQHILQKGVSDLSIRSILKTQVIGRTPGVEEVTLFVFQLNPRTRRLAIRFECRLTNGQTFKSSDYAPFVVAA